MICAYSSQVQRALSAKICGFVWVSCRTLRCIALTAKTHCLSLQAKVDMADVVVHLAGINRPKDVSEFTTGNADLTVSLCAAITATGRRIPLVLASSIQAELANPYGQSKRAAEQAVEQLCAQTGSPAAIYRLPNVFGKWCKPNYNSAVATFCHNIANDLPIQINDPLTPLQLVYIDDVVDAFVQTLTDAAQGLQWKTVAPVYAIALGELAAQIAGFQELPYFADVPSGWAPAWCAPCTPPTSVICRRANLPMICRAMATSAACLWRC